MKKLLILFFIVASASLSIASNTDTISVSQLEQRLLQLEVQTSSLQKSIKSINSQISDLSRTGKVAASNIESLNAKSDSISSSLVSTKEDLTKTTSSLGETVSEAKTSVEAANEAIKNRTIIGSVAVLLALIAAGIVYFILKNKISSDSSVIEKIKATQDKLQEESMKLDNKLVEIMEKQLSVASVSASVKESAEPDHSLALKVADEIVRIEMNLSKMDPTIKGHKQLSKAVERIKNNFSAQGYEMVDMLGLPYKEGTKAVVTFIDEPTLKNGEQIVTGVAKPQINYNGQMIQAAQITVSQNI